MFFIDIYKNVKLKSFMMDKSYKMLNGHVMIICVVKMIKINV